MKQTPFYELSVAFKDRPKAFRLLVSAMFSFSLAVLFICAGRSITQDGEAKTNSFGTKQKTEIRSTVTASLAVPRK